MLLTDTSNFFEKKVYSVVIKPVLNENRKDKDVFRAKDRHKSELCEYLKRSVTNRYC